MHNPKRIQNINLQSTVYIYIGIISIHKRTIHYSSFSINSPRMLVSRMYKVDESSFLMKRNLQMDESYVARMHEAVIVDSYPSCTEQTLQR
jgi:hypothetical protein